MTNVLVVFINEPRTLAKEPIRDQLSNPLEVHYILRTRYQALTAPMGWACMLALEDYSTEGFSQKIARLQISTFDGKVSSLA
jgi:hypothetical protein